MKFEVSAVICFLSYDYNRHPLTHTLRPAAKIVVFRFQETSSSLKFLFRRVLNFFFFFIIYLLQLDDSVLLIPFYFLFTKLETAVKITNVFRSFFTYTLLLVGDMLFRF